MLMYTVRRILATIHVLLAATLFTFVLVDFSGDPLAPLVTATPPVPEETIQAMRERLYLDRSFFERYWLWLTGIGDTNGDIGLLQGKWGPSVSSTPIAVEMADRFWITLRLVGFATIASIGLAIVTGVVSAIRQYSKTDHLLTFVGFLALAMPTFWLAVVIKDAAVWLNINIFETQVFFTRNATSPGYSQMDFWERMSDVAGHAILPTLTLMLTGYALISRFQRASMLEVLNSDYVRLARAKGLRNGVVMRRHALRTALIPVVTLTALTVSGALTGSVVVEFIFGWRGLGTYFLSSLRDIDTFAMMAYIVFSGILVILANLIADLLYGVLDPRIRYE